MDDQDLYSFSWTTLFIVTGLCFLAFSGLMKLLNGSHISFFLMISYVSLGLGIITFLLGFFRDLYEQHNSNRHKTFTEG